MALQKQQKKKIPEMKIVIILKIIQEHQIISSSEQMFDNANIVIL